MKLLLEEQETIIRWDRKYPEASVYTCDPSLRKKLKLLQEQFPDIIEIERVDSISSEYSMPKGIISVRKPRVISKEVKEKMANNMSKIRQKKKPVEEIDQNSSQQACGKYHNHRLNNITGETHLQTLLSRKALFIINDIQDDSESSMK